MICIFKKSKLVALLNDKHNVDNLTQLWEENYTVTHKNGEIERNYDDNIRQQSTYHKPHLSRLRRRCLSLVCHRHRHRRLCLLCLPCLCRRCLLSRHPFLLRRRRTTPRWLWSKHFSGSPSTHFSVFQKWRGPGPD